MATIFPPSHSQSIALQNRRLALRPVPSNQQELRPASMFNSLKHKLSRKDDKPSANGESYFISTAPATRRPNRRGMNAFTTPSTEPPPPYTATATPPSYSEPRSSSTRPPIADIASSTREDPHAFLSSFDTAFLIDDSGSMAGRSWRECSTTLQAITPICTAHDADGIDLYFLNTPDSPRFCNVTDAATVHEIFSVVRPSGGTPTGQRLNRIIKEYLARLEAGGASSSNVKPLNIIVITDGAPADDVESVLVRAAKRLDQLDAEPWQLGVQFVQVGNEEGAREHLATLDDELAQLGGGCRDIVDTVPCNSRAALTADTVLKVVLGAVNRRLDRQRNASPSRAP